MKAILLGALALFLLGIALIALSIAEGGASVALVVIVPVISGSSLTFFAGVLLLIVGFVVGLFAFSAEWTEPPAPSPATEASARGPSGGVGGVVLIGPVPIVFGSWRGALSRRARWLLVLLGAALLVMVAAWLAVALLAR